MSYGIRWEVETLRIIVISTSALPAPTAGYGNSYGGLENIAFDSAAGMAKLGNEVSLITTDDSKELGRHAAVDDEGNEKGFLDVISAGPTAWDWSGERNMYLRYKDWIEQEAGQGQAVIINHTWFGYVYFSLTGGNITLAPNNILHIKANPNLKIIHTVHGTTGWRNQQNQYSAPPTDFPRILGVSPHHAQYLSNCFGRPVRHVFNGIHLPPFPDPFPVPGDYLLSLNRISREKGIHDSIDVALATGNKIKVVGDDTKVQDPAYVWQIMNQCEASQGMAEYIGPVSNADKWNYIANSKALIACPNLESYKESFYLGAIEGFSMGKPILAFANGGLNDTVKNGTNGFLFKTTAEMKELLKSGYIDGVCEKPGEIRAEAEKYTVEKMAESYLDLCKGVFNNDPKYIW